MASKIVGVRTGEKIHEELISLGESQSTIETNNYYIILPTTNKHHLICLKKFKAKKLIKNFYRSNNNKFLSVKEIRSLIKNNK